MKQNFFTPVEQMHLSAVHPWVFWVTRHTTVCLDIDALYAQKDGDTLIKQQKTSNTRGSGETLYKTFSVRNFDWMKGYVSNLMVLLYSNPTQNGCCVYFHRYFSSYQLARTNQLKPLIDSYAIIK